VYFIDSLLQLSQEYFASAQIFSQQNIKLRALPLESTNAAIPFLFHST